VNGRERERGPLKPGQTLVVSAEGGRKERETTAMEVGKESEMKKGIIFVFIFHFTPFLFLFCQVRLYLVKCSSFHYICFFLYHV
jgi:hypothetical protein